MKRNMSEYLPAVLNVVTGAGVFLISFSVDLRFSMSKEMAKLLGMFIVVAGMSLVVWAATRIKGAFLGEVTPVLDVLVQDGPYRFVRHPVYLGMTIALAGVRERIIRAHVHNMLDIGELVFLMALDRKETRGLHVRPDYPFTSPVLGAQAHIIRMADDKPVMQWRGY